RMGARNRGKERMKTMKRLFLFLAVLSLCEFYGVAQTNRALTLIQTIELPDVPNGPNADHFAVDLKGHRLFATFQAQKSVQVIDLDKGKVIRTVPIENPHAVAYRGDIDQFYVTDGPSEVMAPGTLKVFSGRDYQLVN